MKYMKLANSYLIAYNTWSALKAYIDFPISYIASYMVIIYSYPIF